MLDFRVNSNEIDKIGKFTKEEKNFREKNLGHFNVTGFPTALINRQERWASPQPSNVAQVTGKMSGKSYASVAMESK